MLETDFSLLNSIYASSTTTTHLPANSLKICSISANSIDLPVGLLGVHKNSNLQLSRILAKSSITLISKLFLL